MASHDTPAVALLRRLGDAQFLDVSQRPFPARPAADARGPTSLLINGCGRSGTHAIVSLLKRHGILAQHEGHGEHLQVNSTQSQVMAG